MILAPESYAFTCTVRACTRLPVYVIAHFHQLSHASRLKPSARVQIGHICRPVPSGSPGVSSCWLFRRRGNATLAGNRADRLSLEPGARRALDSC